MHGAPVVVGRDEELARIDAFLERRSDASTLLVEGDPGIGKSTLWARAVEHARERGYEVRAARPSEAERHLTYAAVGDLVANASDELDSLPQPQRRALAAALLLEEASDGPVDARAVSLAVLGLLREWGRDRRFLLAVDDAQWLDPASASALSFAVRRSATAGVLSVFAQRRGEHHLDLREVERLDVPGLSFGALQHVLRDSLSIRLSRSTQRRIHERSGGNPFFALELARLLDARGHDLAAGEELLLSTRLEELLGTRISALPPEAVHAVARVAALGEPPLAQVSGDEALEPAFAAGVVALAEGRVRFTHPLLGTAAYAALTPPQRQQLHRELAAVASDAEQRAHHLARGSTPPDEDVAAELDRAAAAAQMRGAAAAAADLAELAVSFGTDARTRAQCAARRPPTTRSRSETRDGPAA
jgi:hypothetical protein